MTQEVNKGPCHANANQLFSKQAIILCEVLTNTTKKTILYEVGRVIQDIFIILHSK